MAITTNSSNIGTINADYPQAGVDNDSQGFRDNFSKIKAELTNAHADLTALDTNAVKNNDAITNMQGNTINNVVLNRSSQKYYSGGVLTTAGVRPVSYEIATYHAYTINSAGITLQVTDWPSSGKYAELVLELKRGGDIADTTSTYDISFTSGTANGVIKTEQAFVHPTAIADPTHPKIYRFWTIDGGQTVYGEFISGIFSKVL
tara:strand:- start:531 stop:1142 length:612 start_codon:yes stop_codon:yes gene_type:complete